MPHAPGSVRDHGTGVSTLKQIVVRDIEVHEWDSWDEFVSSSPQGTLFHTALYKKTIDQSYGRGTLRLLGAFTENGLSGGCAFLDRSRLGQKTAVTPLLTPYTGFVLDAATADQPAWNSEVLEALAKFLSSSYQYQNLVNAPGLDDLRPLLNMGYTVSPRYTYELNLRLSPEELWLKFDGHVRRHIKKAEKIGFEVLENLDPASAWDLFCRTFSRHGHTCPVNEEFFHELVVGTRLKPYRQHFCAYEHGQLVSFITVFCYKDRVYYAVASTLADRMQTGVSSYLVWEVLREHARGEHAVFDFVGANVASIARFKAGFNPQVRLHFSVERASGIHVKLGRRVGKILKW